MSKTIIPSDKQQEKRMNNPGKNNIFVGSRQGGSMEASRAKTASIKHENPEYFKRQSDRKMIDGGPGSGPQNGGGGLTGNKPIGSLSANIAAAKARLSPQQRGSSTRSSNQRAAEKSSESTKLANEHKGGEYSSKDIRNKGTTMTLGVKKK